MCAGETGKGGATYRTVVGCIRELFWTCDDASASCPSAHASEACVVSLMSKYPGNRTTPQLGTALEAVSSGSCRSLSQNSSSSWWCLTGQDRLPALRSPLSAFAWVVWVSPQIHTRMQGSKVPVQMSAFAIGRSDGCVGGHHIHRLLGGSSRRVWLGSQGFLHRWEEWVWGCRSGPMRCTLYIRM